MVRNGPEIVCRYILFYQDNADPDELHICREYVDDYLEFSHYLYFPIYLES
jgi:hypothetical protein